MQHLNRYKILAKDMEKIVYCVYYSRIQSLLDQMHLCCRPYSSAKTNSSTTLQKIFPKERAKNKHFN